ncbi:glycosyltransferase [Arcobacter sp. FWKO B]|uniref:glycosyltransferase n=1 Tax=Arcobacter sp. FWKO B TaxID=2593672 RepID=UPI0018A5BB31|nr:glycosyltransferase [Arcobacter sp. FWKO B]QOG12159.1 glycosyltransferase [Arcobacter sp. FWKO B]
MNLLIVFHSLYSLAGGVDNRISQLEIELSKKFNTELLLFKNKIDLPHTGKVSIIEAISVPEFILKNKHKYFLLSYLYGFIIFLVRIFKTRKFLKTKKFDTILAVDDYFALICIISSIGLNVKIICSVRNNWDYLYNNTMIHLLPDFIYKRVLPKLMNKYVKNVHCVCDELAILLKQNYKIENTVSIYNVFDIENIRKKGNENLELDIPYFINIGHFNKQKNQKDIILAYKYLKDTYNIKEKLIFIGDGYLINECKALVSEFQLNEDILFRGKQKNPYKYLNNAKLYISSSLYEGLPAVFVESLILGVPIVSYKFKTGSSELCNNLTNANYIELAEKVYSVCNNESLQEESIALGNEIINKRFDSNIILKEWLKIL